MKTIKFYKVELFGGPLNGAERIYNKLRIAKSVATRYVNNYVKSCGLSEHIGYDIYAVYSDYSKAILETSFI